MTPTPEKKRRLSLTKKQLQNEAGAQLLALLVKVVADGQLTEDEIKSLREWVTANRGSDLPAIGFLSEIVDTILVDGIISDSERIELQLGIEKVLPVTERGFAREAREASEVPNWKHGSLPRITADDLDRMAKSAREPSSIERARGSWRGDPMTDSQIGFIRSLGGTIHPAATKGDASELIDSLLSKKPISSRQHMVLRFWDQEQLASLGPRGVSEWQDQFYQEDPDRKVAWELFKNESDDNGLQGDPLRVPLAIGAAYLARIKAGGEPALPKFRTSKAPFARISNTCASTQKPTHIWWWLLACAAAGIFAVVFLPNRGSTKARSSPSTETPPRATAASIPEQSAVPAHSEKPVAPKSDAAVVVARLRVSGLFGGARPRASINGELKGAGDVIDPASGLLVYSIDMGKRTVTFVDTAGTTYLRRLD